MRGRCGRGDRHRFLRLLGRHAVDRSPSPTGAAGVNKIIDKPVVTIPGCPPNPYNFLATVVHFLTFGKQLPPTRQAGPSEVRLLAPDPRELRASRPLRRRPLRHGVRGRRPPQGLLPLQARLQGAGDLRQLLDHGAVRRCRRGHLAGGLRPPLHRLHRTGRRLRQADPYGGQGEERRTAAGLPAHRREPGQGRERRLRPPHWPQWRVPPPAPR
jgi:hypothetical protein